eukprot:CAMPEP_0171967030 /NCGR_PEP_ID=MMETSP0993-20121228/195584_1 /TAXON_ID=483369 /ORGANISM="non described non described, Strain CCMP2098" /LENGTH=60 /DNA_ID=CAMNT_0012616445 /DNA_START=26 /DNA_END=204 /DNA_ORIENTATION=-
MPNAHTPQPFSPPAPSSPNQSSPEFARNQTPPPPLQPPLLPATLPMTPSAADFAAYATPS